MGEPLDLHPPMKSPIDEGFERATRPRGFESLSTQTLMSLQELAGFGDKKKYPNFDPLDNLSDRELQDLLNTYVSRYKTTTPDKCAGVKQAIAKRLKTARERRKLLPL